MINFFRKIRQKLLSDGKTGKYLQYAVGEIVLVVFGILIALAINNWNQKRVEVKKELIALNNLILDLEEQYELIEIYVEEENEFYESGIYISEHYAKNKAFIINDTLLSKLNILGFRRTFNPINTTFNELISTGGIGLIRNENLKRRIMRHYKELERVSIISSYNNSNLVDGLFNPVMFSQTLYINKLKFREDQFNLIFKSLKVDQDRIFNSESLEKLYETSGKILLDPERSLHLFNLLQNRTHLASGQITRYTQLNQEIAELKDLIKREIHQ